MSRRFDLATVFGIFFLAVFLTAATSPAAQPVQVFILAGQSNMEGKGKVSLLEHQLTQPETKKQFQHLRKDGKWVERGDVWIKFLDRKGKLTVGYGSPGRIGPELEFGNTVGDHFDQQVLIIKTAWGGKSLYRDFRPPSSGMPAADVLDDMLEQLQKKKPDATMDDIKESFGKYYRLMLADVFQTLDNLNQHFPDYQAQGYQIAGFVWFQGWNDMINTKYTAEYAENMANFIRDVRKDLKTPNLPFVIGVLGVGGTEDKKPNAKKNAFKEAQAAAGQLAEFKGNVAVVQTDQFWDTAAHAVFKKGWKEHLDEWEKIGSDYPFHYLGSVKTFSRIGSAFGDAMIDLQKEKSPFYDPVEKQVEGWTVAVDPRLLADEHKETADKAFTALANHLQRIKYIAAEDRLAQLQKLPIWIELDNPKLKIMQYHPDRGWLLANGHDPRLVKHVHIPHAPNLYARHMWAKHPYVVLHELAHAFHDQVIRFDEPKILAAYQDAKEKGSYEKVLLHTGTKTRHYAITDHKEYFAESTEAYLGVNDFYPFVRAELKEHDPRMYALMEKIWGPVR